MDEKNLNSEISGSNEEEITLNDEALSASEASAQEEPAVDSGADEAEAETSETFENAAEDTVSEAAADDLIFGDAEENDPVPEAEESIASNENISDAEADDAGADVSETAQEDAAESEMPSDDSEVSEETDLFEEEDIFESASDEDAPEKKKGKGKIALIIAAAVVVVIIAAYLILCAVSKNSDTILANTYVDDVCVSSLTVEEAAVLLEEELSESNTGACVQVQALDEIYTVSLGSVLDTDWAQTAQSCYERGHGSFITCGWDLITSWFSEVYVESSSYAAYEDQLYSAIEDAGLTTLTSAVDGSWEISDDTLLITKGTNGQTPDIDALEELIFAAIENADLESVIECPLTDQAAAEVDLAAIYEEVYTEPVNATLDADNGYAVVESENGIDFDLEEAESSLEDASEGETISIELVSTEPEVSTSDLKSKLYADTLGTYTTTVTGDSSRKTNVKLAAAACEVVLLPGETFSFLGNVGQTTAEKGYKYGSAYLNGAVVSTLGGGICQVSSTLYVACLYANLEITERHNHSYTVTYMPLGWDATVSWGGPDFKFTNNTNYPLKIVANYSSDNKLTMSIIGTDETGYSVKIVSQTYSTTACNVVTKEDDTLEEGTTVVEQSGYTGYTVQTWRYVYDSEGNLISDDKEAYSSYKTMDRIIRVGTKSTSSSDTSSSSDSTSDSSSDSSSDSGSTEETTAAASESESTE